MSQVHQFYLHMVPSFAKYARTILWNITDDSIGKLFLQNCMWFYPWLFDVGVSISEKLHAEGLCVSNNGSFFSRVQVILSGRTNAWSGLCQERQRDI